MANSPRSTTNPLVPIGIISAVVFAVMIGVFAIADDAPPDEPTIIAEDVNGEPAGSGTTPEGEADMEEEGVTEKELEEVEPAAGGDIPAQEQSGDGESAEGSDSEEASDGEGSSDSEDGSDAEGTSGGESSSEDDVVEETGATDVESSEAGGADGEQPTNADANAEGDAAEGEEDTFLIDESSDNPTEATADTEASAENAEELPEGRDAQTELTPEECQDIVRDTDDGGAAVVPTPSGPNGNVGDCVESADDDETEEGQ